MKKYLTLFLCAVFGMILLSGCSHQTSGDTGKEKPISSRGADKTLQTPTTSQPSPATNWKQSKYKTVNNFAGVTMLVKPGTASPTDLTVTFDNKSSKQCIYGEFFKLEKKIKDQWYEVPVVIKGDYAFNDIGYNLASGETRDSPVDWKWLYGSLDAGKYRIVKDIMDFRGTGDFDNYYLAAEFEIQ